MSFSSTGSTITQTGTDTSLSGLTGVSGINVTDYGHYKRYELNGGVDLIINGTLTIAGGSLGAIGEQLMIQPSGYAKNTIKVNGTLTIGIDQDPVLQPDNYFVPAIWQSGIFIGGSNESTGTTNDGAGTSPTMSTVWVASGATFRMYGQSMLLTGAFASSASATELTIVDSTLRNSFMQLNTITTFDGVKYQKMNTSGTTDGGGIELIAPSGVTINNMAMRGTSTTASMFNFNAVTPISAVYSVYGVPSLPIGNLVGSGRTDTFDNAPLINFYNCEDGSGGSNSYELTVDAPRYGMANIYQQIAYTVKTSAGVAIQYALIRLTGKYGSTVYTATTDSAGSSGVMNILLAYMYRNDNTGAKTYYCNSNNSNDDFTHRIYSYSHNIGLMPNIVLKGLNPVAYPWTLYADAGVSRTVSAAAALTSIATLSDLYDVAKYWKIQSANADYPTIDSLLALKDGEIVDLGAQNIVIDPSASSALSVNKSTNTITIKSTVLAVDSKFNTLKTSGTISFLGGSSSPSKMKGTLILATPGVIGITLDNITLNFATAGNYDLRTSTITGTLSLVNSSGGAVTVDLVPGRTFANIGPSITVTSSIAVTVTVNNIIAGSRIQVYDTSNNVELWNEIVPTTTFSKTYSYLNNIDARVRLMYINGATTAYKWYKATGLVTASGFSMNAAQEFNKVYTDNSVDGSTVTECSISTDGLDIYIDDPDNITTGQRIYNWYQYYLFTATGLATTDSLITAIDSTHFIFDNSMHIKNLDTVNPLNITGANLTPVSGPATNVFDLSNGASMAVNYERVEGFTFAGGTGLSVEEHNWLSDANTKINTMAHDVWDIQTTNLTTSGSIGEHFRKKVLTSNKYIQLR